MLTIAEVRSALGEVAVGKSDAELERIRDEFATFARALVGISMGRTQELQLPAIRRYARD